MEQILQWVVLFLSTFVYFSIQAVFTLLLFNRKIEKTSVILFALINSIVRSLLASVAQYIGFVYLFFYVASAILTFKYVLKLKLLLSICATSILLVLSSILEFGTITIFTISFGNKFDYSKWQDTFILGAAGRNVGNLLLLIITLFLHYFKMKINLPKDINRKRMFGIIVNTSVVALMVVPNMLFLVHEISFIPIELIELNGISILALFVTGLYNSIKSGELEAKKEEAEFLKLYTNALNESIEGLRGFKHDYNNVIQSIGGYLSLNDLAGLKKYYKQINNESIKVNSLLPLNNYIKNNPALYGLLLSKITLAEVKDVQFMVNISTEIDLQNIRIYDFCKVLGILLDNAFEAALESEKKYVELLVKNVYGKKAVMLEIINSFSGNIPIEKIFDNGFTTKTNHSGFGLWEVKKILARYSNCSLKTFVNENIFVQQLEIL